MHRINHQEAYSLDGDIYTNNAESFFSRMRRAEIGHHHHVAGPYLARFAQESAWREDHRRDSHSLRISAPPRSPNPRACCGATCPPHLRLVGNADIYLWVELVIRSFRSGSRDSASV